MGRRAIGPDELLVSVRATARNRADLAQLPTLPRFEDGHLQPIIDAVYDLADVNEAHQRMENNLHTGKIILRMNP